MGLALRILKSLQDGTLPFKLFNRISTVQYVPAPGVGIDQYIAGHYPDDGWKLLSPNARKAWVQFRLLFDKYDIHTIAYVGANEGHTALALDEAFPGCEFYLFEPVPQTFQVLACNTANHPNMHACNVAAGASNARQDMYVDRFSPASSLLPYEPLTVQEFPFLGEQSTVKVHIKPLDELLRESKARPVDLLLMDVQGYEDEVLRGATQALKTCKVVISELSLQALYRGSSTFDSVYQLLVREGFHLLHLLNALEGTSHCILQIDGVFVRNDSST